MKVETVVGKPHGLGENSHICRLNETQLPGPFQKGTRCSKQMESHQPWHGKRRGKQWQVHFRGKKFVEQHGGWYIPFDGWNPAITHQLIYGSLSPYLQGGYTSQAVIRISEPWTVFFLNHCQRDSKWIWTVVKPAVENNEWLWQHSIRIKTCPLLDLVSVPLQYEYLKCSLLSALHSTSLCYLSKCMSTMLI